MLLFWELFQFPSYLWKLKSSIQKMNQSLCRRKGNERGTPSLAHFEKVRGTEFLIHPITFAWNIFRWLLLIDTCAEIANKVTSSGACVLKRFFYTKGNDLMSIFAGRGRSCRLLDFPMKSEIFPMINALSEGTPFRIGFF